MWDWDCFFAAAKPYAEFTGDVNCERRMGFRSQLVVPIHVVVAIDRLRHLDAPLVWNDIRKNNPGSASS